MKNLGEIRDYLGMQINKDENGNFLLNQSAYIHHVASEFGLGDAKPSNVPLDPNYQKLTDESNDFLLSSTNYISKVDRMFVIHCN